VTAALKPGDDGISLLRQMLRIRRFEEKCAELYSAGKIRGFLHLYIGEEAVAVGVMSALTGDDSIVATYREHGHALARGIGADALMAEMYGKTQGCSRGRGGSMHVFDAKSRFFGGNAIVGGGLPLAVGLALADHYLGRRARVTACFFGDGAVAEGEFHESMNLAALWRLPVLFVCENNLYAMGTRIDRALSQTDVAARARSYGIEAESVDGMDVAAVRLAAARAVAAAKDDGPRFLECRTYRFRAHSMFDAELYRDKAEVDEWKQRDPIALWQRQLESEGRIDAAGFAAIDDGVQKEIGAAVAFAEAGTWEPIEQLTRDVYTPRAR
jgi:pyruvate dehydrogenase E1 component alpha subunit